MSEKTQQQDERRSESTVPNHLHEEAEKAREEWGQGDPMEDRDNIQRSFPDSVDRSGTPDTQPHQPAEALGEGQVSIDSMKKEAEELSEDKERHASRGEKREGIAKVTNEDQEKADRKARPNAPENK